MDVHLVTSFMKKLIRVIPGPVSLSNSSYETHSWKKFKGKQKKKAIWNEIMKMQGGFCCYCESSAVPDNGHIEHFFIRERKTELRRIKRKLLNGVIYLVVVVVLGTLTVVTLKIRKE